MEKENITTLPGNKDIIKLDETLPIKQVKFLSCFLASSSLSEACYFADIHRSTFYRWLKIPEFHATLQRLQNTIMMGALLNIKRGFEKASAGLVNSLQTSDSLEKQKFLINAGLKVLELELKYKKHQPATGEPVSSAESLEPDEQEEQQVLNFKKSMKRWQ